MRRDGKPFPWFDTENKLSKYDRRIILLVSGFEDVTTAMIQKEACRRRNKFVDIWGRNKTSEGEVCDICGCPFEDNGVTHPDEGGYEYWPGLNEYPAVDRAGIEIIHAPQSRGWVNEWLLILRPGAVLRCTVDTDEYFYGYTGQVLKRMTKDEAIPAALLQSIGSQILQG